MENQIPEKTSELTSKQKQAHKSKRFLIVYCIALFVFAGVLILFSYLSQLRVAQEADQVKQELSQKAEVAAGFENRLEQVSSQNEALESSVSALKEELAALKDTKNATAQAYDLLWRLVRANAAGDRTSCTALLKQASELDMKTLLSSTGFAEYTRIQSIIKGS